MSVDKRLRDALAARGRQVSPGGAAWEAIQAGRRRRGWPARIGVLSIAATVVVVLAGATAFALTRDGESSEQVTAGPTAEETVAASSTAVVVAESDGEIVRTDLADPSTREVLAEVDEDTTILDLTVDRAESDVYVSTFTQGDCRPVINRLTGSTLEPVTEGWEVAVAGSTMAFVRIYEDLCLSWPPEMPSSAPDALTVRDLTSGTEHRLAPNPTDPAPGSSLVSHPALSSDGSRLVYRRVGGELSGSFVMVVDARSFFTAGTNEHVFAYGGYSVVGPPAFEGSLLYFVNSPAVPSNSSGSGELLRFDTSDPAVIPQDHPFVATLPSRASPVTASIDVLNGRILWLGSRIASGASELWWQELSDGAEPRLVGSDVIDAAFAFPR